MCGLVRRNQGMSGSSSTQLMPRPRDLLTPIRLEPSILKSTYDASESITGDLIMPQPVRTPWWFPAVYCIPFHGSGLVVSHSLHVNATISSSGISGFLRRRSCSFPCNPTLLERPPTCCHPQPPLIPNLRSHSFSAPTPTLSSVCTNS